jgi:hypothetical protein
MKVVFDNNAPLTNAILGAALSGGDAAALAKALVESQKTEDKKEKCESSENPK